MVSVTHRNNLQIITTEHGSFPWFSRVSPAEWWNGGVAEWRNGGMRLRESCNSVFSTCNLVTDTELQLLFIGMINSDRVNNVTRYYALRCWASVRLRSHIELRCD